jgi:hypothetical protein
MNSKELMPESGRDSLKEKEMQDQYWWTDYENVKFLVVILSGAIGIAGAIIGIGCNLIALEIKNLTKEMEKWNL